ncbi:MAG TPA: ABC transporter permease [Gaiellales bacterium]|nr:ABC transporter permease [Gaiellales bacterium]
MSHRLPAPSAVFTALVFVFLYLPIGIVVLNSFNADEALLGWGGFTTQWYSQAFSNSRVRDDFVTSLQVALASTAISLVIAVTAGLWMRRASTRARRALDATTYMRIVLPEVVVALALFLVLRRYEIPLGVPAIVAGHVIFNSAYATLIIQARLATMTDVLEEAAADLGASPVRTFRRVTLPLLMPAVIVAALLTLSFSFDDVVTSLFLGGPNAETLPVLLLGLIRLHVTPEVNAIAVGVTAITMVTFGLAAAVMSIRDAAGVRTGQVDPATLEAEEAK